MTFKPHELRKLSPTASASSEERLFLVARCCAAAVLLIAAAFACDSFDYDDETGITPSCGGDSVVVSWREDWKSLRPGLNHTVSHINAENLPSTRMSSSCRIGRRLYGG